MTAYFEAYIDAGAMRDAEEAARKASGKGMESLGLFVGERFSWKGRDYAVAEEFITAPNDSTAVSVRFERNALADIAGHLNRRSGKMVVGWCHSHLGYGCFLSGTDVATQKKYFSEPHCFALVIDTKRREKGGVQKRAFKVKGNQYYEVPFAIVERKAMAAMKEK